MKTPAQTYVFAGMIERPTKRGYRWVSGYSWINPETGKGTYPWVTYAEARKQHPGCKIVKS